MKSSIRHVLGCVAVAALFVGASALEDPKTGSISGTVTDASGKPLEKFVLKLNIKKPHVVQRRTAGQDGGGLMDGAFKLVTTTKTDKDGKFKFDKVKPGEYYVTADEDKILEKAVVEAGKDTSLKLQTP